MEKEFVYEVPSRVKVQIPLPHYVSVDDYAAVICSSEHGHFITFEEARRVLLDFVLEETEKWEDERDEAAIEEFRKRSDSTLKNFADLHRTPSKIEDNFAEKFLYIMSNYLIRSRNWEIAQVSNQCERVLSEEQNGNLNPQQLTILNKKLRTLYTTYANQVEELAATQRKQYRQTVDSLYSRGSIPATFVDEIEKEGNFEGSLLIWDPEGVRSEGIDESHTIYIGAQLKSMHNARIVSVRCLTDVCQTFKEDWTPSSRLEMATKIYARSLGSLILLVPRDPFHHINSSSSFHRVCEQSTELHFSPLGEQLKEVLEAAKRGNSWRADCLLASSQKKEGKNEPISTQNVLRNETALSVGDVYCTRHSNLHQVQIVFHLVVDDLLPAAEINSRHPCLNGIRNIIRMAANFGISTIHLPLLLIDRPDESTTISWCVKRAEMVYKCVKGYLMEVCGGSSTDALPHFNVHFLLPDGLAPVIYATISSMFPTIFHLVPSVAMSGQRLEELGEDFDEETLLGNDSDDPHE
ncbi:unnamed protein product [Caenorhabditis auriculariae]|uniref:Macro domain-containing protein n=1 Tax=Caenorhabditis auriculariae TaxID=2777116 RepID=A0A8S1GSX4_9PELO|nr:unnamed protein product [Caenorhabditis auriculariae]